VRDQVSRITLHYLIRYISIFTFVDSSHKDYSELNGIKHSKNLIFC
jgi:hypothetical protein